MGLSLKIFGVVQRLYKETRPGAMLEIFLAKRSRNVSSIDLWLMFDFLRQPFCHIRVNDFRVPTSQT